MGVPGNPGGVSTEEAHSPQSHEGHQGKAASSGSAVDCASWSSVDGRWLRRVLGTAHGTCDFEPLGAPGGRPQPSEEITISGATDSERSPEIVVRAADPAKAHPQWGRMRKVARIPVLFGVDWTWRTSHPWTRRIARGLRKPCQAWGHVSDPSSSWQNESETCMRERERRLFREVTKRGTHSMPRLRSIERALGLLTHLVNPSDSFS